MEVNKEFIKWDRLTNIHCNFIKIVYRYYKRIINYKRII